MTEYTMLHNHSQSINNSIFRLPQNLSDKQIAEMGGIFPKHDKSKYTSRLV
jgi:hypothetical protein